MIRCLQVFIYKYTKNILFFFFHLLIKKTSLEERGKLFDEVESEWIKRESRALQRQNAPVTENDEDEDDDSSDEIEECIVKVRILNYNDYTSVGLNLFSFIKTYIIL